MLIKQFLLSIYTIYPLHLDFFHDILYINFNLFIYIVNVNLFYLTRTGFPDVWICVTSFPPI